MSNDLQGAQHERTETFGSCPISLVYSFKDSNSAIFAQFRNLLAANVSVRFAPSIFDYPEQKPVAFPLEAAKNPVRYFLRVIVIPEFLELRTKGSDNVWTGNRVHEVDIAIRLFLPNVIIRGPADKELSSANGHAIWTLTTDRM